MITEQNNARKTGQIFLIYLLAFCVGILWTYLPSLGNLLTNAKPVYISQEQYGSLILPLVLGAICSSNFSGWVGHFWGIKKILSFGFIFTILSMFFFILSCVNPEAQSSNYLYLIVAQLSLGLAIGAIITTFNVYLFFLTEKKSAMLITAFYATMSIGGSVCPILVNLITHSPLEMYKIPSLGLFVFILALIFIKLFPTPPQPSPIKRKTSSLLHNINFRFWLFVFIATAYGISESSFSDWGTIFLNQEINLSIDLSNLGLSIFWGSLSLSQIGVAFLIKWVRPRIIYRTLPILIILSLLEFTLGNHYIDHFIFLALGGIGCSGFFPLSVNFSEQEFNKIPEIASGSMVSGYFVGSGLGAFLIGFIHNTFNLKFSSIFVLLALLAAIMGIIAIYLTRGRQIKNVY